MENEYRFNYDEIKRIFESVPQTTSTKKGCQTVLYKTRFQPRTKLSTFIKDDIHSKTIPLVASETDQELSTLRYKVQRICCYQIISIERVCLQTHQGFSGMSNVRT